MDDRTLRDAIQAELDWNPGVDSTDIGVLVDDGVVSLTGHVSTYAERLLAESIVKRMRGVRGVVQEIEVRPREAGSDEEIAHRVLRMLDWDVVVPRNAVKVRVSKGLVTLSGKVEWEHQRRAAEDIVRRLHGVTAVVNQIMLEPKVQSNDVRERIEEALERYADVEAKKVRVEVKEGRVILEGEVRAPFERDLIERAAWAAPGVTEVEDKTRVTG